MAGKRHDDGRVCLCDRPDGSCAGLLVRRLSQDRVHELAEEIWTASSGDVLPARPLLDPRSSRAGASAQAAYRQHRDRERANWRLGWVWWTYAVVGVAAVGGLITGVTIGAWLGWPMALVLAAWTGWRLRFRPSPSVSAWGQQAARHRRTARELRPLAEEGYLVLHDITLPGWLDSLEHLVVGPTGVWVVESSQARRSKARCDPVAGGEGAGVLRGLRWKTEAIAELLDRGARIPVRGLLCVGRTWASCPQSVKGVHVATARRLGQVVRHGPPVAPAEVERTTAQLLEVLRPAA